MRAKGERLVQLWENAGSNSDRLLLLAWFGAFPGRRRRDSEEEVLNEQQTQEWEADLARRVVESEPAVLSAEPPLNRLLFQVKEAVGGPEALRRMAASDEVMKAMVMASVTEVISHT